ncbi:MAG: hypothetical protein HJJLKODD_02355 [Phycisphaerae bacterium]|nr:hypothetical protein [Phycisphaerae bacterium]
MKRAALICLAMIGMGWWATQAYTQEERKADPHGDAHGQQPAEGQPSIEMKPVTVGPEHKLMQEGAGEWDQEITDFTTGPEPKVSKGRATCKVILDGLALTFETESHCDQGTFKGFGVTTWNTMTKNYEMTWVDTMSYNGLDSKWIGTWDAATETMTWNATCTVPGMGPCPMKMVEKRMGKDKTVAEFYWSMGPDQKETKSMQIVSTRVK